MKDIEEKKQHWKMTFESDLLRLENQLHRNEINRETYTLIKVALERAIALLEEEDNIISS